MNKSEIKIKEAKKIIYSLSKITKDGKTCFCKNMDAIVFNLLFEKQNKPKHSARCLRINKWIKEKI